MHNLDYDLDGEILVVIIMPDVVKLSEPINCLVLMMIGKVVRIQLSFIEF